MYPQNILDLLGLPSGADEAAVMACITTLKNQAVATAEQDMDVTAHAAEITALKAQHQPILSALKAQHETRLSALKNAHDSELSALKAGHETTVTALKAAHAVAMGAANKKIGTVIADGLAQLGKIDPADKAAILALAQRDPDVVLTTFKGVKVGAVVPLIQRLQASKKGAARIVYDRD